MDSDSPSSSEYDESEWTDRPQHSYRPLETDEIRILHLLPGRFGEPLRAVLEHASLATDPKPEYEAISYAWGSKDRPADILLENDDSCLQVTTSLYEALAHLRYTEGDRALWADAVCINQDDIGERSTQVAIMHEVFRNSSRVLVWLGRADSDNESAFATIDACSKVPLDCRKGDDAHCAAIVRHLPNELMLESRHMLDQHLHSFGLLLQRPWFSRLWVVQEVAVAGAVRVCCGQRSATWKQFVECAFQLSELREGALAGQKNVGTLDRGWLDLTCGTMTQIESHRVSDGNTFSVAGFLSAMINFSTKLCQEPQDRIYSLRQFLGLHEFPSLQPDYRLKPRMVNRRATEICLFTDHAKSTRLPQVFLVFGLVGTELSSISASAQLPGRTPSWVPDYHNLSEGSRGKHNRYVRPDLAQFHWKEDEHADVFEDEGIITFDHDAGCLSLKGQYLGRVDSILLSSAWPLEHSRGSTYDTAFQHNVLPILLQWVFDCAEYIQETSYDSNTMQMILCCHDPDINDVLPLADFMKLKAVSTQPLHLAKWLWNSLHPFLGRDHHPRYDSNRVLCHTFIHGKRTFAWVPKWTQPGDYLAAFDGLPYALVLRYNDVRSGNIHRLVGDAHIAGLPARIDVNEMTFNSTIRRMMKNARRLYGAPEGYVVSWQDAFDRKMIQ